ncbi:TonB-dependent receptor plug domain-containing protein [Rhizosaccharibacter radicis]|uniref:TonB-dependent receptor n=1 Tax=Rhizosaccharibacter radicis TaxID=2782605 RepID=A0ABT1VZP8_9PROT|nr:TonB-dependent receptor [Acetobacteraceae bacterium KSS12]
MAQTAAVQAASAQAASAQTGPVQTIPGGASGTRVTNGLPAAAPADAAAGSGEQIIVTGTRDPHQTARTSISPVVVISAAQLRQTGQTDLRDALVQVAPSVTRQVMGLDQGSLVDSLSLRGLSSDQTLVLVNGKRRHTTAALNFDPGPQQGTTPVDIDMIPVSAVSRIEILQDGAAAQYGSDAIAGVINIILKSADHGLSAQALNGGTYKGDGFTTGESLNGGVALGSRGFANLSAEFRHQDRADRSGPDLRTGLRNDNAIGSPQSTRESISLNAAYDVTPGAQLYSFDTFTHRDAERWAYRRLPSSLPAVYPNGYQPVETLPENDFGVTVGLKGADLLGWNWDASSTYGGNHDRLGLYNTANTLLYAQTGDTPQRATLGTYTNSQWTNTLDLRRAVKLPLLAAPLNVAVGAEYRYESYSIHAGDPASYVLGGTQGYQGLSPDNATDSHRNVTAGYVDLSTKLLPHWQVDVAGRFEHYTDAGDTETGKISTRYDITRRVAIRGTVSNGFRAPTLAEEHFVSIVTSPTYANAQLAVDSPAARALGASSLKPERSTNYSAGFLLEPVDRLHVGVDAYQISIRDRIIDGGVYNGQPALDALALQNVSLSAGLDPSGVSAQYFANGASTRTRGLDVTAQYTLRLRRYGSVDLDAAVNFNQTVLRRLGRDANGNPLLNAQGISYLTSEFPANKLIAGGNWRNGRWNLALHEIRYGHTATQLTYYQGPNSFSNSVFQPFTNHPRWLTNIELGYQVTPAWHLALGANNLFNEYPSSIPIENSYIGAARYDTSSQQIGQEGGFYYFRVNYTL